MARPAIARPIAALHSSSEFAVSCPCLTRLLFVVILGLAPVVSASANDPKPTPENTIHIGLANPVLPQKFSSPLKFYVGEVVDRAGNAQPMLVTAGRGGIFVDRLPVDIVREALETSLKAADMLAPDAGSADFVLNVYLFHFGLAPSMGDLFGQIELAVTMKDPRSGKSQQLSAAGTSISHIAMLKKNEMKNLAADFNGALADAIRNFLRGQALHDAVVAATAARAPAAN